ncbi:MAG TPA: prephenate dehydratase [Ignavibacteria bacterium]|nr:prephenate dehydratase [Ignavibacteria bacterium]HMR39135.1 prephenate dehydratase [Ignavibacteria bacterium]
MKVAIQGIRGAFHEIAARQYFDEEIETINCTKFSQLFEIVRSGKAEYGVVAIENTLAGSILENYSLLKDSKLKITGEISLYISQNLMALPGTKTGNITEVYSHPMAILQSNDFFSAYPDIKLIEWSDTASSARKIAEENLLNTGAIASEYAAKLYGLEILAHEIETNKNNYTRFIIIHKKSQDLPENNKASVCFELDHSPGSLTDVLNVLRDHGINLTKIQSLPVIGSPYKYYFHADLEWKDRSKYDLALNKIIKTVSNLSMLGEYKRDEMFNHEAFE